ncbi:MAG: hypothetical protein WAO71_13395 [Gallionella sp.]
MEQLKLYLDVLAGVANVFAIAASALAIYLFVTNRGNISVAFQFLLNYSFQTTLAELKEKLERLNEYNANEPSHLEPIKNILHEVAGQIRGNPRLQAAEPKLAAKLEAFANSKKLAEPLKRSMVSEVRETLRNIQVNNMESITRKQHE